jgi:hypothetical protein
MTNALSAFIAALSSPDAAARTEAAAALYRAGGALAEPEAARWRGNAELAALLGGNTPHITVGVAVAPETFARIRAANGAPRLAEVPPEQDAAEFELHFPQNVALDILTTRDPAGSGAIARYLAKLGEGIQQVEYRVTSVERATQLLKEKFGVAPVYPQTRPGADGTRVNFFLAPAPGGSKVLIEFYQRA